MALTVGIIAIAAGVIGVVAQGGFETAVAAKAEKPTSTAGPKPNTSPSPAASATIGSKTAALFQPPSEQDMPKNEFGKTVKMGQDIFEYTERYASQYVGNTNLRCSSCHLNAGRLAHSAPLWAAYVSYPAYRSKNKRVNTFPERLQGCFKYSMNGTAPPLGDPVLVALESYAYWLASGAPIDSKILGRGYPTVPAPPCREIMSVVGWCSNSTARCVTAQTAPVSPTPTIAPLFQLYGVRNPLTGEPAWRA